MVSYVAILTKALKINDFRLDNLGRRYNLPFVEIFKTFSGHYFYDVNKNSIQKISEELYSELESSVSSFDNRNIQKSKCQIEYEAFEKIGYLTEHKFQTHSHPMTDLVKDYVNRKLSFISLQVTQKCNLRCKYCPYTVNDGFNRVHSDLSMSKLVVDKALDILLNNSIDSELITIGFYGGEPLLEFDLICYTVEKAKKIFWGKKLSFTLTTNGTLFNYNNLKFLNENFFSVMVSIDGPKHLNDKNRVFNNSNRSVFDEVITSIIEIYYKYENLSKKLGLSMVIDPENDITEYSSLFSKYYFFNNLVTNISLVDESHVIHKKKRTDEFRTLIGYNAFLTYLEELSEICEGKNIFFRKLIRPHILKNLEKLSPSENLPVRYSPAGQCVPGARLFINAQGNVYPCEKVNENSEHVLMGSVFTGINPDRAKKIINASEVMIKKCRDCFALRHCANCIKDYSELMDRNLNYNINNQCDLIRKKVLSEFKARAHISEAVRKQKELNLVRDYNE